MLWDRLKLEFSMRVFVSSSCASPSHCMQPLFLARDNYRQVLTHTTRFELLVINRVWLQMTAMN